MRENDILNGSYQILQEIGRGGLGVVYLGYHLRLEKYVAIKCIPITAVRAQDRRIETDILKNLHHPNLPQVYDYFGDKNSVYTVMDFIEGVTLEDYINAGYHCGEEMIRRWFEQMVSVLDYLHSQTPPILHCDIKPGNIIITPSNDAILIDFNVSLTVGKERLVGISPRYASPEQLFLADQMIGGCEASFNLNESTDVYSLAASFYHLMSGIRPSGRQQAQPLAEMDLGYSEGLCRLIDRCMQFEAEKRPKGGKQLLKITQKLTRQISGYRLMFGLRLAVILISAVMLGSGIYCLIRGSQARQIETYMKRYTEMVRAEDSGDIQRAEQVAYELLSNEKMRQVLQDRPADNTSVYQLLGDVAYDARAYSLAAERYREAAKTAEGSERCACLREQISALAEAGDLSGAQQLLQSLDEEELNSDALCYVRTVLAARSGDTASCMVAAQALLQQSSDDTLCARAAVIAAESSQNPANKIKLLEQAENKSNDRSVQRGLVRAYAALAKQSAGEQKRLAIQKALQYSELLSRQAYATLQDRLNYATVLRLAERYSDATNVLESLLEDYPNDYRVLMSLAFAYYEKSNKLSAESYCKLALDACARDYTEGSDAETDRDLEDLKTLAELLGIQ